MKKRLSLILLLSIAIVVSAQIPNGYYSSAEGKTGSQLKTALFSVISSGARDVGYNGLYDVYRSSDVRGSNQVWDMYSTCTFYHGSKQCGSYSNICDCYNREHMIPQSWFNEQSPMRSDAFHVYPTDGKVNGIRSNLPFGETSTGALVGGNGLGKYGKCSFSGYVGTVFEPSDEYKGDVARTYFYFVTRYEDRMSSMSGDSFDRSAYPALSSWTKNLMLKWHRQDPVSKKELDRNNAVYKAQYNRNPYIDYPDLAEYIWGTKIGSSWYATGNALPGQKEPSLFTLSPNPAQTYFVMTSASGESLSYKLYNVSGQLMREGEARTGEQVSVLGLAKGIYIVKVASGGKTSMQKLIINAN